MALTQAAYRFGGNDGTEATHSFLAALNTPISRDASDLGTFLCRILVQATGGVAHNNQTIQWQFSLNGGAFTDITTTSATVKAVTTTVFANDASPTSRLGGTGTFESSSQTCTHDGATGGAQCDIVANGNAETVAALQLVPGVAAGSTIDLRVTATAGIATYTQVARINVTGPSMIALDAAAASVAGADAAANARPVLDAGALTIASADLVPANFVLVALDTGAGMAIAGDLAALQRVGLDSGLPVAASAETRPDASVGVSTAILAVAGADVVPLQAGAVQIEAGAVNLSAADVLPQVTQVALEGGGINATGSDLAAGGAVQLEPGGIAAAGANLGAGGLVGGHMASTVVLDVAVAGVVAADVQAVERLVWQAFSVSFAGGPRFAVGFGGAKVFGVAA